MKPYRKTLLLIPAVTGVLECLPEGVAMRFATPDNVYISYYPYWHMLPFGYGNFAPLITAVLTVVLLILAAVGMRRENLKAVSGVSGTAAAVSLIPILPIVSGSYTLIGGCISVLLAAECALAVILRKKEKFTDVL